MCCTSLRGAAFFGASIHIAVGFLLFSRYVVATLVFTFYNFNDLFSEKVTTFLAPFMIYVTLLLALGLLIFHSVEKEYFFLLKWSSVAFSLLQLAVFVTILLLKLSPHYQYHQFPFLPDSLTNGYPPSTSPDTAPAGPGLGILTIPHGAILSEKDKSSKSAEPPDPGGSPPGGTSAPGTNSPPGGWREGILLEVQRLSLLVSCVLLTLVYLLFLFLYIRQLNAEDTGHVFGHAQAITRNIAFYVQPQFTSGQPHPPTNTDNNKLLPTVQRSQTQIPQQFLPQQQKQQQQQLINQSPKKVSLLLQQNQQVQSTPPAGSLPPETNPVQVQGSPARQLHNRPQQQQQLQQQQLQPQQNQQMSSHNNPGQGNFSLMNQSSKLGPPMGGPPQQQLLRGGQGQVMLESPGGQQGQILGQRGPIPAQVRINFYPKDLMRQNNPGPVSPVGLPQNNIRGPRAVPLTVGGDVEGSPLHHPQQQPPPPHPDGQQVICHNPASIPGNIQQQLEPHPQDKGGSSQQLQGQYVQVQKPLGPIRQLQQPHMGQQGPQHHQGQHLHGQVPHGPQLQGQPLGQHHQGQPLGQHLQGQPLGQHLQGQPLGQHHQGQPLGQHHQGQPLGQHLQGQPLGQHLQGQPLGQHHQGQPLGQHLQGQAPLGPQHVQHGHSGGHPLGHPGGHHQFQRLQYGQQGVPHPHHPHHHNVQGQGQVVHHLSSYPNQSDSASPPSSVAYSPNPPLPHHQRGKHPISIV